MNGSDCSQPAPLLYRAIMQASHLISFPVYAAALFVLIRYRSKSFQTYKYYLIAHTVVNILAEIYMSIFMLPMTYLPYPVIRCTGLLAQYNFSGLFQWYILATFVMLTGASINEMFYYRFKVTVIDAKRHKFMKPLQFFVYSFKLFIVAHTIFAVVTFDFCTEVVEAGKKKLFENNPGISPEVTCYTSIFAAVTIWTQQTTVVIYTAMLIVSITLTPLSVYYIMRFLMSCNLSASTIRMQKMFVVSLSLQALVHGGMIAVPVGGAVLGIFSSLPFDESAYLLLLVLNFHGFGSTCSMILFTKPLRDKFLGVFSNKFSKPKLVRSTTISVVNVKVLSHQRTTLT